MPLGPVRSSQNVLTFLRAGVGATAKKGYKMSSNRASRQIVSSGETANARLLKESLSTELAAWIRSECRDTSDAAKRLGITTERVSDLLDSRYANFTIEALVDSLLRVGKKVQLHVR